MAFSELADRAAAWLMCEEMRTAVAAAARTACGVGSATAEALWLHAVRRLRGIYRQRAAYLRAWLDGVTTWREFPASSVAAATDEARVLWPHLEGWVEGTMAPLLRPYEATTPPYLVALVAAAVMAASTHGDEAHVSRTAIPVLLRALRCAGPADQPEPLSAADERLLTERFRALLAPSPALKYAYGVGDTWPQPTQATALSADPFAVRSLAAGAASRHLG